MKDKSTIEDMSMDYKELLSTVSEESNRGTLVTEIVEIDDERDGEALISKDIARVLDKNKINYIINPKKLGHPRTLENAVVDGVHIPEVDPNAKRPTSKKIKIVYDDTLNLADGVDAYVVQSEDIADSMEASGLNVIRYPNQLIEYLNKK